MCKNLPRTCIRRRCVFQEEESLQHTNRQGEDGGGTGWTVGVGVSSEQPPFSISIPCVQSYIITESAGAKIEAGGLGKMHVEPSAKREVE